ncbi:hypothetical protein ACI65C_010261 [Semiaphis heraclei]
MACVTEVADCSLLVAHVLITLRLTVAIPSTVVSECVVLISTVYSITVALSLLRASVRDLCLPDNMPRPNNAPTTSTRKDINHENKNKNINNIQAARLIKNTSNNSMMNPTDDNSDTNWTQNINKRNHSDSSEPKSPDPTSNNKNYKKLFVTANRYEVLTPTEPTNSILPDIVLIYSVFMIRTKKNLKQHYSEMR